MGFVMTIRMLVYGPKADMEAFLGLHKLIQPHPIFTHFKDEFRYYELPPLSAFLPGEIYHALDFETQIPWINTAEAPMAWENFRFKAEDAGLLYEMIKIDLDSFDSQKSASAESLNLIYVAPPTIEEDFGPGKSVPLL